ncbi:hypothetical protein [Marinobacter azerbaijanicus]|nr:hypothetical protein [Marinobacter sp. TBZ242]
MSYGAHGGWFGPDNYEECVLEKMKGQTKEMMWTAQTACEKEFPYEKELYGYKENLEISWATGGLSIYLMIKENRGDYMVTRYKAKFAKKQCSEVSSTSDYLLTEEFRFPQGAKRAYISTPDAEKYKCMRTEIIWGQYRK